jgi:hypothetical protein
LQKSISGFKGGGMDMGAGSSKSSKSSGPAGGASSGGNYGGNNFKSDPDDNREQYGAQGQYSRPPSTPSDGDLTQMIIENNMEHRVNTKDLLQHQVWW